MTILQEAGADQTATMTVLPAKADRRSSDIIRDYVDEKAEFIDFMFVGNKGADFSSINKEKYLGSVANEMVRNTRLNLFFMV